MYVSKSMIWFTCIIFVAGIIFGSLTVLFMSEPQRISIENQVSLLFDFRNTGESTFETVEIWKEVFRDFLLGGILLILSISVIGVPVLLLYICVKGFILGFTSSFIIQMFGTNGIVVVLATILPQNALLVPILILFVTYSISFAKALLFRRIIRMHGNIRPYFANLFMSYGLLIVVLILVTLYESLLSSHVIERALSFIL